MKVTSELDASSLLQIYVHAKIKFCWSDKQSTLQWSFKLDHQTNTVDRISLVVWWYCLLWGHYRVIFLLWLGLRKGCFKGVCLTVFYDLSFIAVIPKAIINLGRGLKSGQLWNLFLQTNAADRLSLALSFYWKP